MKIKHSIKLSLKPYGKEGKLFQIRLRTSFNGMRLDMSTGCQICNQAYWDDSAQFVIAGYKSSKGETSAQINSTLRNAKDQMELAFEYFEANDVYPTVEQLKSKYIERISGIVPKKPDVSRQKDNKESDFFPTFEKFCSECGVKNAWTKATFQKMEALRKDLLKFDPSMSFEGLDEAKLTHFVSFLRDEKQLRTPRKAKGDRERYEYEDFHGIKNNTIVKKLDYLKWFLNWASINGFNHNLTYQAFKPTLKQTQKKVIYLTQSELKQLMALDLSGETSYLEPDRDVFVFCCFSGLRHSDVSNLRRSDIKDGKMEITTIKTADSISIEINDITKSILEKYKDIDFPGDRALPLLTNQNFNRNLKTLCSMAGINEKVRITTYSGTNRLDEIKEKWELIGSHCGRRTFIVIALSMGIPPSVVMKWTGHSDFKSMKPYVDIVDKMKAEEMKKFNSLIIK